MLRLRYPKRKRTALPFQTLNTHEATASKASTTLATGENAVYGFSMRETTGTATALVRLLDGEGGALLAVVSLLANESVRDSFSDGLHVRKAIYAERVSGTTEMVVYSYV